MTWTFNPAQLATWQEAHDLAARMEAFRLNTGSFLGGGVSAETENAETSGIYVPFWTGGPGGFPEPNDSANKKFWLHFRFNGGKSGLNVGLILDKLRRYNDNEMYVFMSLSNDLQ
jgi:hypothetical protein